MENMNGGVANANGIEYYYSGGSKNLSQGVP